MPIFNSLDDFKDHKQYLTLLKRALLGAKQDSRKNFLYFRQYAFGPKKLQLVLVDYAPALKSVILKGAYKPSAEGFVSLTPADELNFESEKSDFKRIRIKRYFSTLGPGIKPVYVPAGEVDEEAPPEGASLTEPQLVPPVTPAPPQPLGQSPPPSPQPPAQPIPPEPPPRVNRQMEQRLEFENNKFALNQRIQQLRKQPCAPGFESKRNDSLTLATSLVNKGDFANATKVLDQLAAALARPSSPPAQPPPKPPVSESPTAPVPPPKLSAYMNTTRDWRQAKKTAADGVFALKNAIFAACDPILKDQVKAKIDQLNSILTLMDDAIIAKIQEAGSESDEERQGEKNRALAQFAGKQLVALRNHPFAPVADSNPFGNFTICGPVETVLTKISSSFGI